MTAGDATSTVADLHVHTTASDGQLRLAEVPAAARDAGLDAVAITDHDRVHPGLAEPHERRDGVTLIRGIELRVERSTGERIDLLGYAADETDPLVALIDRLQRNRIDRARRMVAAVEAELSVELAVDIDLGVGRPHIARAIANHPETTLGYQDAFDTLIGGDGPCYVPRDVPALDRGIDVLTDACPVVAVAHPLRYADVPGALVVARRLGAVERWYPYGISVDERPVVRAVESDGLLETGGSDAHDDRLGTAGLDATGYERFRSACEIA